MINIVLRSRVAKSIQQYILEDFSFLSFAKCFPIDSITSINAVLMIIKLIVTL